MLLRTFGAPALVYGDESVQPLRQKDLALLVYLRVEPPRGHARSALATLLWSENSEANARHSLSQTIGRLRDAIGQGVIAASRETVHWRGSLPCDVSGLENGIAASDPMLSFYTGDFASGMTLGEGAASFESWADSRRAFFRRKATQLLEAVGQAAEREGDHERALQVGQRLLEIDPILESAHRRVMRAWVGLGERAQALRHYRGVCRLLAEELGLEPDPATRALAQSLGRDSDPSVRAPISLTAPGLGRRQTQGR